MFSVGQKVICINSAADPGYFWTSDAPVKGRIYTVKQIGIGPICGNLCLWLVEITNGGPRHPDTGYRASRFRPIVSRKTDISIFKAMLNPSPVTVDAMADMKRLAELESSREATS